MVPQPTNLNIDGFNPPSAATTRNRGVECHGSYEPDAQVDVVGNERRGVPVVPNR